MYHSRHRVTRASLHHDDFRDGEMPLPPMKETQVAEFKCSMLSILAWYVPRQLCFATTCSSSFPPFLSSATTQLLQAQILLLLPHSSLQVLYTETRLLDSIHVLNCSDMICGKRLDSFYASAPALAPRYHQHQPGPKASCTNNTASIQVH
jgi:hypothetical protein